MRIKASATPTAHKTLPVVSLKVLDEAEGICEELVAGIGNIDYGRDQIQKGAFVKTITERGPQKLRVLDAHQTDSSLRIVGKCLEAKEVGREAIPPEVLKEFPDLTGALWVKTQYLLDTPEGLGVFLRKRAGALDEMSIGYDPVDTEWVTVKARQSKSGDGYELDPNGKDTRIRLLKQIRLHEYSPVPFGMNAATTTVGVKGADDDPEPIEPDEVKTAVPYGNLPLADRGAAWSGSGARGRVKSWAGGDTIDWAKYKKAFLWFQGDNAETEGAYKYPIADIVGGKLTAVPKGIFAAAASLQGGRTPTTIPEADQSAMKATLGKYYAKMAKEFGDDSIVAPWDDTGKGKKQSVSLTALVEGIEDAFEAQYPNSYVREVLSDAVIVATWNYGGEGCCYYQVGYTMDTNGDPVFDPPSKWISGSLGFIPDQASASEPATGGEGEGMGTGEGEGMGSGMMAAPITQQEAQSIRAMLVNLQKAVDRLTEAASKAGTLPAPIPNQEPQTKVGPEPPPTEKERLALLAKLHQETA